MGCNNDTITVNYPDYGGLSGEWKLAYVEPSKKENNPYLVRLFVSV